MTPREAQKAVHERFPQAFAEPPSTTHQGGQVAVYDQTSWAVFPDKGLGIRPLGTGRTQEAAWIAAADAVQLQDKQSMMQRWVTYLLNQGYQRQADDENRLFNPSDPEMHAFTDPAKGYFGPSPKLADHLSKVTQNDGGPPN